jgi:hypothetical protein
MPDACGAVKQKKGKVTRKSEKRQVTGEKQEEAERRGRVFILHYSPDELAG